MPLNEECKYLSEEQMERLKAKCKEELSNGRPIKYLVGCIYGLYQDYVLSEAQESELYELVDPEEKYNECSKYWNEIENNTLANFLGLEEE